jgi:Leucine-rich repeat (LRR) protein
MELGDAKPPTSFSEKLCEIRTITNINWSINNLCKFDLLGCLNVQELPTSIGQLNVLEYLNISWCKGLQELPTTIGHLHALQNFDLSNCFKIQELPTFIG